MLDTIERAQKLEPVAAEPVEISEDEYDTARTERIGWCVSCGAFTTADVEAQEVTASGCTDCLEPGVLGALRALRGGFIAVSRALVLLVVIALGVTS